MKPNDLTKFKSIFNQIKEMQKYDIKVGLPSDVGTYPNGDSIVEVGERHEFGLGVPRRSFLRASMIQKQSTINKAIKSSYKRIIDGRGITIREFNKLGLIGQNISKESFKSGGFGKWQDISQATKDAKGSDEILQDTGRLVQSVTSWISKK